PRSPRAGCPPRAPPRWRPRGRGADRRGDPGVAAGPRGPPPRGPPRIRRAPPPPPAPPPRSTREDPLPRRRLARPRGPERPDKPHDIEKRLIHRVMRLPDHAGGKERAHEPLVRRIHPPNAGPLPNGHDDPIRTPPP